VSKKRDMLQMLPPGCSLCVFKRGKGMTKNMLYSLFFILAALIVACSNKAIADAIGQPRDSGCIPISFETPKSDKVKRFIWRNLLNKYDDHYPTKEEWNATFVALVDLNGDGQNDVIVTRKDYCGSDGCSLTAIISTQKGGYEVDIAPSVYLSSPVCLMPKKTNGFFDIEANNGRRLKFNLRNKSYD